MRAVEEASAALRDNLNALLAEHNLSQRALARAADLSHMTVNAACKGSPEVKLGTLCKLAGVFGLQPGALIYQSTEDA